MRLRTRLRAEQEALQFEGLIDSSFPTLDERVEQINAFIHEESTQLRALGYTWNSSQKTSPHLHVRIMPALVSNPAPQLNKGAKRNN